MKKKRYIILLIILAIYVLAMYYFIGADNLKKEKQSTTIMIGDSTIWNYSSKKWFNITSKTKIKDLSWKKYTVYIDNQKLGKYYLWHDDKWYLFNDNKEAVNATGNLVAYKANYDIKIKDYEVNQIDDYTYVNEVLQKNNLSTSQTYTVNNMTSIDIDNDGITEDFYVISNVFPEDFNPDKIFAIVFMVKEGKVYSIYNDISKNNNSYNGCKPYLNTFIDVNNDNTYELVLSCAKYSAQKRIDMLYKLTDEGFKILISNQ